MSNGASFLSRGGVERGAELDEDLIALGMDYSAIVRLLATVRREYGVEIDEEDFFAEPTLRRLRALVRGAEVLEGERRPAASPAELLDEPVALLAQTGKRGQPLGFDIAGGQAAIDPVPMPDREA